MAQGTKRQSSQNLIGYTAAMYAVRLLPLLKATVVAAILGPTDYGLIALFALCLSYAAYLDLGVFHGQNREIPLHNGRGETETAGEIARAAQAVTLLGAAAATAILVLASVLSNYLGQPTSSVFILSLALAVVAQQAALYRVSLCYAEMRFALQATALTVGAVVDGAGVICIVAIFGVEAGLAAMSVGFVVQYMVLRRGLGRVLRPSWNLRWMRRLIAVGLPIEMVWLANTNLVGVDKLVALVGFDQTALGLYSLAAAAGTMVMVGPAAVAAYMAPRLTEALGRHGATPFVMERMWVTVATVSALAGLTAGVLLVLVPWTTRTLLPEYVAALEPARLLIVASALLSTLMPIATVMVGLGRQWVLVAVYTLNAAVNLMVDIVLVVAGAELWGIAAASAVSYLWLLLAVHVLAARESPRGSAALVGRESRRVLQTVGLGCALGFGVSVGLEDELAGSVIASLAAGAAVGAVMSPPCLRGLRRVATLAAAP